MLSDGSALVLLKLACRDWPAHSPPLKVALISNGTCLAIVPVLALEVVSTPKSTLAPLLGQHGDLRVALDHADLVQPLDIGVKVAVFGSV